MILILLITASAIGMILTTFNLPDIKPLNCASCLSGWVALIMLICFAPTYWWAFPTSYLITNLIYIYETK